MYSPEFNVGVVGTHVEQSLSPVMHNAAYREMGVDLRYGIYQLSGLPEDDIEARQGYLGDFLLGQSMAGVRGMSVTMPFKQELMDVDQVMHGTQIPRQIGAANTLVPGPDGAWIPYNTDWSGALQSLAEVGFKPQRSTALIIGAGGTARALAYGLAHMDAELIIIANRSVEKAQKIAQELSERFKNSEVYGLPLAEISAAQTPAAKEILAAADVVYNTTNIGQTGTTGQGRSPLSKAAITQLPPGAIVSDAVYMPQNTTLLRFARVLRKDLRVVDGTRMLLHQAAGQVALFTGDPRVPIGHMDRALQWELARRAV